MQVKVFDGKTRKLGPLLVIIMVAVAAGGAFAGWILSRQVTTTMTIIGVHDMDLLDPDLAVLTNINFGNLRRNGPDTFPLSGSYFFDNTGDYDLYVSYTLTDWPADVVLTVEVFSSQYGTWDILNPGAIWQSAVKHQGTDTFQWRLTLNVDPNADLDQTYTPTIDWDAFDTPTG